MRQPPRFWRDLDFSVIQNLIRDGSIGVHALIRIADYDVIESVGRAGADHREARRGFRALACAAVRGLIEK